MRRIPALRSLAFAFVAGVGTVPALLLLVPLVGRTAAWSWLLLGLLVLHTITVAPSLRRGVMAAGVAFVLGLAALTLGYGTGAAVSGCAVVLALCRSLLLYRQRPARALLLESALVVGGLLFAGRLLGPTALSAGLAVWGFFLVQSLFFVVGGLEMRPAEGPARDPFDEAARRLQEVLGQNAS